MNFSNIRDELTGASPLGRSRFDAAQSTQAGYWIVLAYARIWAAAPWPWKMTYGNTITTTASTRGTTLWPSGSMTNLRVAFILDENQNPIPYVTNAEYFDSYGASTTTGTAESPGHPGVWTWMDGNILWGPVPDSAYSFTGVYESNIFVRAVFGAVKAGGWDGATLTDVPAWTDFQYGIVLGASSIGLAMAGDPEQSMMEGMFLAYLQSMKDHYLPGSLASMQFPTDRL